MLLIYFFYKIAEEEENKRDKKLADKLADKKFINDDAGDRFQTACRFRILLDVDLVLVVHA